MQPPGNLRNPGLRSASSCTRSARKPPGLFFQVSSGKREIISRSRAPTPSNQSTILALASPSVATKSTWYLFQSPPPGVSSVDPITVPAPATSSILIFIEWSEWFLASIEKWYFIPFLIPIPRKPSFSKPNFSSAFVRLILTYLGLFVSDSPRFKTNRPSVASVFRIVQPRSGFANSNERFLTSSAYKPPSAAKLISSKNIPHIVD